METRISLPEDVGLVYVSDSEPGIRRLRRGRGFCYKLPNGDLLVDDAIKQRIASLGLPPAYRDVWICMEDNGHLQATGFDARGRKQYRYHKGWQELRSADKFDHLIAFGRALPRLRRAVRRHLEGTIDNAETVVAGLVLLLDEAQLRVGSRIYASENRTYGATTLQKRHVRLKKGSIELSFTAKGGKRVKRVLRNPRLNRILEAVADLPGRQLFVWRDEEGTVRPVDSGRLNAYLADQTGMPVSAKTFRTWAGSLAAFVEAREAIRSGSRPTIAQMAKTAAMVLHNTPAICRSSYIHPAILSLASAEPSPELLAALERPRRKIAGLRMDENRMLGFLENPPGRSGIQVSAPKKQGAGYGVKRSTSKAESGRRPMRRNGAASRQRQSENSLSG